jgi:LPPG:FO 2-phospho-L-lactate transferase
MERTIIIFAVDLHAMLTVLSGGTGTPKLLRGFKDSEDIAVVVNTAEDIWVSNNKVTPDIDSVLYTLAGIIDEDRWWGIRGDTFATHEALKAMGHFEELMIGDKDRATHILRTELLSYGSSLADATQLSGDTGLDSKGFPVNWQVVDATHINGVATTDGNRVVFTLVAETAVHEREAAGLQDLSFAAELADRLRRRVRTTAHVVRMLRIGGHARDFHELLQLRFKG